MMGAQRSSEEKSLKEEKWFAAADEQYARFKKRLESLEALGMEHCELEKEIEREGYELMRLLYQDHLILRAWSERDVREQGPVVGSDGLERRHRRSETKRSMMTPFGVVEVERAGYSAPGCRSLYPLDAELNLPSDSFSHGVRERVAREAAKNSFEGTVDTLTRTTGAHVGKRQAEKLAVEACDDGNQLSGDGCSADCTSSEECGDGFVNELDGEQCDDGETPRIAMPIVPWSHAAMVW